MTSRYTEALIEDAEYHDDWTWTDASAKYGRSRAALRAALLRINRMDLINRLDDNSGVRKVSGPYVSEVERILGIDPEVTWRGLAMVLGRKPATIRQYLYNQRRADLVRRIRGSVASGK